MDMVWWRKYCMMCNMDKGATTSRPKVKCISNTLQWRHNERLGVSNHQPHDCLLNRLFRHRSKKTLKLRVTGFCEGKSPVTGEFPAQRASNAENVFIWWRHHEKCLIAYCQFLGPSTAIVVLPLCFPACFDIGNEYRTNDKPMIWSCM